MQAAVRANRRIAEMTAKRAVRTWSVNWDGVAAVGMMALSAALLVLAAFGAYSLIFD